MSRSETDFEDWLYQKTALFPLVGEDVVKINCSEGTLQRIMFLALSETEVIQMVGNGMVFDCELENLGN